MIKRYFITLAAILLAALSIAQQAAHTSKVDKNMAIYIDVWRQLDMSYCDTLNYDNLLETSINQMLVKVDPYTVYIPAAKTSDLRLMTTGKYGGIGAIIMQRDKKIMISDPYFGMPAQRNDVRAGDEILSVDGVKTEGKNTSDVSFMLRGTPGTTVNLVLKREGEKNPIKRSFEREQIKMPPVDYYCVFERKDGGKTGYVSFNDFTEDSSERLQEAIQTMVDSDNIDALIIDLRNNGGGIIDEAVKIVGLFVDKGTIVVDTKGRNNKSERVYRTPFQPKYKDMQLAVLVNHSSASASEIVAGALQDLDRATIVGTRTYGKGLVQSIRPIAYDGHLKVTTAKYYIPSGRCIQAIDYSKRREDGSVERMPDSLTHEFKTRHGRIVRDGGGIEPDTLINDSARYDISFALFAKNMYFDFATHYRTTHDSIAPIDQFVITDEIFEEFVAYLEEHNFIYETETNRYFKAMYDMAKMEDLTAETKTKLEELKPLLTPDFKPAIYRNRQNVEEYLGGEIVSRYYFQNGRITYQLRYDDWLKRALTVFDK